ncbi:MAG: cytochrome c [Cellvibrionaceae bacterium]
MSVIKYCSVFSVSAVVLFSASNFAQTNDPEQLMHERHENFETIGESFKAIRDQLRSGNADMAIIATSAQTINTLAQELHTWFPEGTGPETGIETEAKAEIWQDKDGFNAAASRLVEESGKFATLASSGDASAIMGGVQSLGGACKNCHDTYRVDDD